MKTTALKSWTAVCLSVLMTTVGSRAFGDQATAAKSDKTYTGTVTAVDPQNHVLTVKGTLFSKKFNLGEACEYSMLGKTADSADGLRAGQKVMVSYLDTDGVLIANRIEQRPRQYTGTVRAVDQEKRTLTLRAGGLNREFNIGEDCDVRLRNDQTGSLHDLKPGHRVTVTYELPIPNNTRVARQIARTSATFEGELTAIDLTERTIKARAAFNSKKFNLARDCAVILKDRDDAQLADLKPGDRLVLSYEEVNGVNIVNRIAIAEPPPVAVTALKFDY